MKYYIQEIQKEKSDIHVIKHFCFKVKNTKLENKSKFKRQVNKVIERIKSKHKTLNDEIIIKTGTVNDDVVYNIFRLRISVNCSYNYNKTKYEHKAESEKLIE